jgi:hypothetical protein
MATSPFKSGPKWLGGQVLVYLLPLLLGHCSRRAEDCSYTLTCGAVVTGGTDPGLGGVTSGGSNSIASSSGVGGVGGTLSVTGGVESSGGTSAVDTGGSMGGVMTTIPTCTPACSGEQPICLQPSLTCVQCTNNDDCGSYDAKPYCDIARNTCVECLDNTDCEAESASLCLAGKCSPCATNDDCSHIPDRGVCRIAEEADAGGEIGTCVQCTGTDYQACRTNDAGPSFVCDSLHNTCSRVAQEHSAGLCKPCVSDAQCQPGSLCVEEVFKSGKVVGRFCFPRLGVGEVKDCTKVAPYVKALTADSIDGTLATVCMLRMSTCTALNQLGRQSCTAATGGPADSLCGEVPGEDSKCAIYGQSQYMCTVPCINDDDCLGLSCTSGTPNKLYCSLM